MTSKEKWFFGIFGCLALIYNYFFLAVLPNIQFVSSEGWFMIVMGFFSDIAIIIGIIVHFWKKRLRATERSIDEFISHYLQEDDLILNCYQRHIISNDANSFALINNTFNKYLNTVQPIEHEIRQVNSEITVIIEEIVGSKHNTHMDDEDVEQKKGDLMESLSKLKKLKAAKPRLDTLYEEKKKLIAKRDKVKIIIDERHDERLEKTRSAFDLLQNSKKKYGLDTEIQIDELLNHTIPKGIKMFSVGNDPIVMNLSDSIWCIYAKSILAFSNQGDFLGAYQRNCFTYQVEQMKKNLFVSNDNPSTKYDQDLDVDSRCISTGTTNYHWEHERNDGMPDQRYRDNRLNKYRNDLMEYGRITFFINKLAMKYVFSSSAALNALENALTFVHDDNSNSNRVLNLLQLIDFVSSQEESTNLLNQYAQIANVNSYCYLTM